MSTIECIDSEKPMTFTGCRTTKTDDPVMVEMAKRQGMENLVHVAEPVTEAIILSIEERRALLDWLKQDNLRRGFFDENLQCMSQTGKGEPVLTGWMDLSAFEACTHYLLQFRPITQYPVDLYRLAVKFSNLIEQWRELGVEDVYFDGYKEWIEPYVEYFLDTGWGNWRVLPEDLLNKLKSGALEDEDVDYELCDALVVWVGRDVDGENMVIRAGYYPHGLSEVAVELTVGLPPEMMEFGPHEFADTGLGRRLIDLVKESAVGKYRLNRRSITITGGRPAPSPDMPSHLFPGCGSDHAEFKVFSGPIPSVQEMRRFLEARFGDIANIEYDESTGEGRFVFIDAEAPPAQ